MTYVTEESKSFWPLAVSFWLKRAARFLAVAECLFAGLDFFLEFAHAGDRDVAAFDLDEAFGLKAAHVARNQLANGADLRSELLIARRQGDNQGLRRLPGVFGEPQQHGDEAVTDGGE